ncbi:CBS domain-containing protein [Synechococcus elongatus]|uniref:CBS domain-containing protein n=1 Tax=Synechococcus elongatus PCC 11801 TaxID=2219813 RepID=A0AAN1UUR9_SYNEL|nr:CBS domain-containing protein [Synechococcus elongatus]AZB72947.1 phosphoribulokinase [Synechococcus elongatus PCC 11801]
MTATVADFMTRDPIAVKPQTPLTEAIRILADKHISGLPVVDEAGQLVGVISETDLMWRESGVPTPPPYIQVLDSFIYLENPARYEKELHKALGETVAEVMTAKPLTIAADRPLPDAARLFNDRKVHRLFVLSGDQQLVGVLTRGDIIRAMAQGA